ncbi:DUF6950 family protein [Rhizobium sp. N324]|uniref:DUF6950 family protein n=1 Tax=Rhizobium sp. N324 TaxID=1703969 RepID=UPI0007E9D5A5|nr:hypothetical protein [Rhizobium sp. N324]ANM12039.1 hypothetical protein AMK05_CH03690 [Rhizobium sp. N324]
MLIRDYIERRVRFCWGGVGGEDCTTWCGSYGLALTGRDPAEAFRGTYNSAEGAHALIDAAGGLALLVGPILTDQGWRRVQQPTTGDMAVIRTLVDFEGEDPIERDVSALCFGPLWSVLGPAGPGGIAHRKAQLVACWRWPR